MTQKGYMQSCGGDARKAVVEPSSKIRTRFAQFRLSNSRTTNLTMFENLASMFNPQSGCRSLPCGGS